MNTIQAKNDILNGPDPDWDIIHLLRLIKLIQQLGFPAVYALNHDDLNIDVRPLKELLGLSPTDTVMVYSHHHPETLRAVVQALVGTLTIEDQVVDSGPDGFEIWQFSAEDDHKGVLVAGSWVEADHELYIFKRQGAYWVTDHPRKIYRMSLDDYLAKVTTALKPQP